MSEIKHRQLRPAPFGLRRSRAERALDAGGVSAVDWARRYRARLRATDTVVVAGAATIWFALHNLGITSNTRRPPLGPVVLCVVVVTAWCTTLWLNRSRESHVAGRGISEYKRVIGATTFTFGGLGVAFGVGRIEDTTDLFIIALPVGAISLITDRWLWRQWLIHQRIYEHYLSHALVVGHRDDVECVIEQIQSASGAAYAVVGASVAGEHTGAILAKDRPVPIVCDLDGILRAAGSIGADTVIVAGRPPGGSTFIRSLSWQLEGTSMELVLAAPLVDVAGPRIRFRPVAGLPLIHVQIPQFEGGKHVLKRVLDITASGLGLLAIMPILLAVAIAIRVDDGGPILFTQDRVGRNGKPFRMVKFRSMVPDAERALVGLLSESDGNGVLFKLKADPRVTRVGRVLRRYSLDELPQLWNVFIGQMSMVGPRPPLQQEVDAYEERVHRRFYIKPGLTGMWQIGGRSDLSWEESVRLDLYYVENWSLTGDILILLRTIRAIVKPRGAY